MKRFFIGMLSVGFRTSHRRGSGRHEHRSKNQDVSWDEFARERVCSDVGRRGGRVRDG